MGADRAALEREIEASKREALRAKYAADVPEKLRPLLTGTTDDEQKAGTTVKPASTVR